MMVPESLKERSTFSLEKYAAFCNNNPIDLLQLDASKSWRDPGRFRLVGLATPSWDPDDEAVQACQGTAGDGASFRSSFRVEICGFDITGIKLDTDALYIETRLARYCLQTPSPAYDPFVVSARLLLNYCIFGRREHVLGQTLAGPAATIQQLNEALRKADRRLPPNELPPFWDLSSPLCGGFPCLEYLAESSDMAKLLHKHLPNTPLYGRRFD